MDAIVGKGNLIDNHIGISGGGENTNFYLGVGNSKQEGIIRNSTYERTSLDFSTESKVSEKTTFKGKFSFSSISSNRIQQGSNLSGLMLGLYRTPADFDNSDYIGTNFDASGVPFFNSHRAYRQNIGTSISDTNPSYNNPLWTTDIQSNPNKVQRYIAGIEIRHEVKSWLTLLGRVGFDGYNDKRISMFTLSSAENGGNGSANESITNFDQYNIDFMALGDLKLNTNLGLSYIAGLNLS